MDHGFDPSRLIAIDLARTPSAAATGVIGWEAVEMDDCFTGPNGVVAGTTLGPRWPEVRLAGAVYLIVLGVRTVLFHPEFAPGTVWQDALAKSTAGLGLERRQVGNVTVFRVRPS